ncbi:hypothetical protein Adt_23761 [Abeliophyllum distichum]|uniref:Uncharacterized protein n=1 Tax=Abeliophyllum distichum TaxID=126358 RepID=A0ABD1SCL1_9LAMI
MDDLLEANLTGIIKAVGVQMRTLSSYNELKKYCRGPRKGQRREQTAGKKTSSHHSVVARTFEEAEANKVKIAMLNTNLEASDRRRLDVEATSADLLAEKKSLEENLENAKAEYTANFHNTGAYSNFSNYFTSIG